MRSHRIRCVVGCTWYVSAQCLSASLFTMTHMRHAGHQGQSGQDSTQSGYGQYPGAPPKRTGSTGGGTAGPAAGPANGGVPVAFGVGTPRQDGASPPSTGAAGADQQPLQRVIFASPRMHASLVSIGMKCDHSRHDASLHASLGTTHESARTSSNVHTNWCSVRLAADDAPAGQGSTGRRARGRQDFG